jgi:hypothetical protein
MTRVWNTPVFIIATVYFVVDGVFSHVTRPITVWLAKKKLLERARLWVTSLRPYPSLALFAVPVIILEPAKPLAGYLLGTGHFFFGAVTFITAEVLKLTLVETVVSTKSKEAPVDPSFRLGLSVLARHDGRRRIDGSLEGITKTGGQCRPHGSDPLAST